MRPKHFLEARRIISLATLAILFHSLVSGNVFGDAVVVTEAMKASTIAEVFVEDQDVRIALEIGAADLAAFQNILPDEVYAALGNERHPLNARLERFFGEDLVLRADGNLLPGRILKVAAGKRVSRDEITGDPLPVQPTDSELVVFADLVYALKSKPSILTLRPPLRGNTKNVAATIGFVAYHKQLPVNDFRYLSSEATLDLDWNDPWYSRFRNPNLRRQNDAPIAAFLYVEPFEVRKEIIVRPRDIQAWHDLGIDGQKVITVDEQDEIKNAVAQFLTDKSPLKIDGRLAEGRLDRVHFIQRSLRKTGVVDPPEDLDTTSATLGVIFVYPIDELPSEVSMRWELFNEKVTSIPGIATDEAGGLPATLTPDDPVLHWQNFLTNPTVPAMLQVTTPPVAPRIEVPLISLVAGISLFGLGLVVVFRHRRERKISRGIVITALVLVMVGLVSRRVARATLPNPLSSSTRVSIGEADEALAALLHNTYRAFDHRDESLVYDRLAKSIAGDLLTDVYLQTRQSIELESQGGARVTVKDVEIQSTRTQPLEKRVGFSTTCRWIVSGSVGHWGHIHQRTNQYEAAFIVEPVDETWKITAMELLDERRLDNPTVPVKQ
jgi:hypothetical protein